MALDEKVLLLLTEAQLAFGHIYAYWTLELLAENALLSEFLEWRQEQAWRQGYEGSQDWVRLFLTMHMPGKRRVLNHYDARMEFERMKQTKRRQ